MDKDKAIKEIKQLKELLDSGILTQEEYDSKSADLKKIILDSENKDEPLDGNKEKEFWEQKAKEKLQAKTLINSKNEFDNPESNFNDTSFYKFLKNITGTQYFFGNGIVYVVTYVIGYYFGSEFGLNSTTKPILILISTSSFILPYFRAKRLSKMPVFYAIALGILLQLINFALNLPESVKTFNSINQITLLLTIPCGLYLTFANARQKIDTEVIHSDVKKESEPLQEEKKTVNTEDKSIDDEEKEIRVNSQSEEDITVSQDYTQGGSISKFLPYFAVALMILLTFVFILLLAQEYK